jgi:cytochrome c oxidase subunit 2
MTSLTRRMAIALPLAALALIGQSLVAHADEPWVNAPAGAVAREIQPVYWILFFFAVVVLVIVDGGIIAAALKYRERPGHIAKQFHGHNMLELTWTLIPTAMVIFFSVISFQRLQFINDTRTDAQMTIQAEGRQWSWTYQYPAEERFRLKSGEYLQGAEELHVPVGTKVRIELTSPDVIHDFFVPQIGGKKDAVPGRTTELWIQADRPGTYKGQCAEFCGDGHADMLIVLYAHEPAEYQAWLAGAIEFANLLDDPETARGRDVFRNNACVGCHLITGVSGGRVGPELTHIASKPNIAGVPGLSPVNPENLKKWISNPAANKPGTAMPLVPLSEQDLDAIVKFLAVLK